VTTTQRLTRLEQDLWQLAVLIDGRHARDGRLTWPMIRDQVEGCWQQAHQILNGSSPAPAPPSVVRHRHAVELEEIGCLLETLSHRVAAVRRRL
jgi:hypothetical protein